MPLPLALAVALSFVAFSASCSFGGATVQLGLAALVAIAVRGRLPLPRQTLVPAALVLGLVIFSTMPAPPLDNTLLLATGYAVGLFFGLLTLLFLVRQNTPGEALLGVFLAMMLMLVAGSTTDVHPFAELLTAQGLLLGLGLRALNPSLAEVRGQPQERSAQLRGTLLAVVAYGIVIVFGAVLAYSLYSSERFFNRLLLMADTRGYSYPTRASLREILDARNNDRVIARVFSSNPAPYLVARCYLRYDRAMWEATTADRDAPRVDDPRLTPLFDGPLYALTDPSATSAASDRVDRVETSVDLTGTLFVPRDGHLLGASTSSLRRDLAGVCYLPIDSGYSGVYEIFRGAIPRESGDLPDDVRQKCLQVPDSVSSFIGPLVEEATRGATTPLQTAQSIEQRLRTSYTYGRGYPLGPGEPLQAFLERRVPAHCELFATSMVMMLRTKGIPSRYITGFMVNERNEAGNYSVVREGSAHAWVEAWIPPLGWVQFDPTPPDGQPQAQRTSAWKQWLDVLMQTVQRLRNHALRPNWRALLRGLLKSVQQLGAWLLESPWRLGVLGLLLLFDVLRRTDTRGSRWLRNLWRRRPTALANADPLERRLHGSLSRFDTLMARGGQPRPPEATLREFNQMLRRERRLPDDGLDLATAFLERYEKARYATPAPTVAQVEALENLCNELEAKPLEKSR